MRIRQPFAKQPIPRFGGGSTRVFIFAIPYRCCSEASTHCHRTLQSSRGHLRGAENRHQVDVTLNMQSRSAQPQMNIFHGFDVSTSVKMRIALRSLEEDEALLDHSFDQLLGCTATMRMINRKTVAAHAFSAKGA